MNDPLLDQTVLHRVVGQVAVRREPHLRHDARAIRTDRLDAQQHAAGQVAHSFAARQSQEYLKLALGQSCVGGSFGRAVESIRKQFGDLGGDVLATSAQRTDRFDDLVRVARLVEVAAGAVFEQRQRVVCSGYPDRISTGRSGARALMDASASTPL